MNRQLHRSPYFSRVFAAMLFGSMLIAWAQPDPEPPRRRPASPPGLGPGEPPAGRGFRGLPPWESVLDDEQRRSFREAMASQREERQAIEEKLQKARRELDQAIFATPFDEATVRKKARKTAKQEAELTTLRAKAMAKMQPKLTAEQMEELRQRGPGRPDGPPPRGPLPPDGAFEPPSPRPDGAPRGGPRSPQGPPPAAPSPRPSDDGIGPQRPPQP